MEVGEQHVDGAKAIARCDEDRGLAGERQNPAVRCGGAFQQAERGGADGNDAMARGTRAVKRTLTITRHLRPRSARNPPGRSGAAPSEENPLRVLFSNPPWWGETKVYADPNNGRRFLMYTAGRTYLDMVNNVTVLGHAHPRVAETAARPVGRRAATTVRRPTSLLA